MSHHAVIFHQPTTVGGPLLCVQRRTAFKFRCHGAVIVRKSIVAYKYDKLDMFEYFLFSHVVGKIKQPMTWHCGGTINTNWRQRCPNVFTWYDYVIMVVTLCQTLFTVIRAPSDALSLVHSNIKGPQIVLTSENVFITGDGEIVILEWDVTSALSSSRKWQHGVCEHFLVRNVLARPLDRQPMIIKCPDILEMVCKNRSIQAFWQLVKKTEANRSGAKPFPSFSACI